MLVEQGLFLFKVSLALSSGCLFLFYSVGCSKLGFMGHALCFKLRRITDYYAIHGCCSFCFYKRSFSYSEQCLQGLKPELRSTRTYQNTPLHLDIPSPHVRLRPRTHRIACFARPARTARRCPLGCPLTPSTRKRARQWRMPLQTNERMNE